jgi:hypothetical protein
LTDFKQSKEAASSKSMSIPSLTSSTTQDFSPSLISKRKSVQFSMSSSPSVFPSDYSWKLTQACLVYFLIIFGNISPIL